MIKQLLNRLGATLYVQIWADRIRMTDANTGQVHDEVPRVHYQVRRNGRFKVLAFGREAGAEAVNPFAHPRSLFADFIAGELLLNAMLKRYQSRHVLSPSPNIIIHPMEKTEGGLTTIEIRAFREMALGAGARGVVVYQGDELQSGQIDFDALERQGRDQ